MRNGHHTLCMFPALYLPTSDILGRHDYLELKRIEVRERRADGHRGAPARLNLGGYYGPAGRHLWGCEGLRLFGGYAGPYTNDDQVEGDACDLKAL